MQMRGKKSQEVIQEREKFAVMLIIVVVYSLMGLIFTGMITWMLSRLHLMTGEGIQLYLMRMMVAMFGFSVALEYFTCVVCWIGPRLMGVTRRMVAWYFGDITEVDE